MSIEKFVAPKKIEIEVEALDGTMAHFEVEKITSEMIQRVTSAGGRAEKDAMGAMCEQMAVYFGGSAKDFRDRFDARVLKNVIVWMNEQIRNPT
jgi:hypothetical protein